MQVDWWLPLGDNWPRLVLTAGLIGAVSLLEAISIAKALAERNGDTVDAGQELLGAFSTLTMVWQMLKKDCPYLGTPPNSGCGAPEIRTGCDAAVEACKRALHSGAHCILNILGRHALRGCFL